MQMSEELVGGADNDLDGVEESTPTIGHSRRLHSAPLGTLH